MADRPTGYGLTAELQAKKDAKYDPDLAYDTITWMEEVLQEPIGDNPDLENPQTICELFKDGVILCKLANCIKPGVVHRINNSKMAFKMMENIGNFLSACESFGIKPTDLFQTVDLYEGTNIPQVVTGLLALGRKAQSLRPDLPLLGPKESQQNKRQFTQEQINEGKAVIGLQMGTNRGASQAGMTPYGLSRQIEKTNLKQ